MINFKKSGSSLIDVTKKPEQQTSSFFQKSESGEESKNASSSSEVEPMTELENFAKKVLARICEDGVPPTPNSYQLYFDRLLDEETKEFKKNIFEIMELEQMSASSEEQLYQLEGKLKEDIEYVKKMLTIISTVYSNLTKMIAIAQKREKELDSITNPLAIQNIVNSLHKDLSSVSSVSRQQLLSLKDLYTKSSAILSEISAGSIFDEQFSGLYNRKYLISQLDKESKAIAQFNHNSTIIFAKLSKDTYQIINNQKGLILAIRTVAKLFLKTSRRSDIIAHYGDGYFAMLLRYTDIENAKRAIQRLNDLVAAAHFFYNDRDIELKIKIGLAKINPLRSSEDTIKGALEALKSADAERTTYYAVCKDDEK